MSEMSITSYKSKENASGIYEAWIQLSTRPAMTEADRKTPFYIYSFKTTEKGSRASMSGIEALGQFETESKARVQMADVVSQLETRWGVVLTETQETPDWRGYGTKAKPMMNCELCGDERAPEELNVELLCPPCQEREERSSGE